MNVTAEGNKNPERRAARRRNYTAPITVSFFNREASFHDAQTLNHSEDGMALKSRFFLKPKATVCIRVKKFHPDGRPCSGLCEGLHSVCLAEIKWCREEHDSSSYRVGVKYLKPDY